MGFIAPMLWDDDRFISLNKDEMLVWIYMLSGRHASGLPGLFELGPMTIAERSNIPDINPDIATSALERLIRFGMIHADRRRWIIRVPNAPKYNPPSNPNHVRGWYRKWLMLPSVPIRQEHVPSLRAVVEHIAANSSKRDGAGWRTAWDETFGTTGVPLQAIVANGSHVRAVSNQESFFAEGSAPKKSPIHKASPKTSRSQDFGVEGTGAGDSDAVVRSDDEPDDGRERDSGVRDFDEAFRQDRPKRRDPDLSPGSVIPIRDPDPRSQIRTADQRSESDSGSDLGRPTRFWELQEDLRAPLVGGQRRRATQENLASVVAFLDGEGVDDTTVELVLRSFAVNSPQFLISGTNWKPSVFRTELAIATKRPKGHYAPTGTEKYGEGGKEVPGLPTVKRML